MAPHGIIQLRHPEGPYLLKLNADGFRDRDYSDHRFSRKRILSVGSSLAIGHGVPLDDTYCKVLERSLSDVEVMNLGCFGYCIDQEYVQIQEEVPRLKPDLVIQCMNDSSARWIMAGRAPDCDYPKCHVNYSLSDDKITLVPPNFNLLQRLVGYSSEIGPFKINFEQPPDSQKVEQVDEKISGYSQPSL